MRSEGESASFLSRTRCRRSQKRMCMCWFRVFCVCFVKNTVITALFQHIMWPSQPAWDRRDTAWWVGRVASIIEQRAKQFFPLSVAGAWNSRGRVFMVFV